ncbi:MAG: hypothetical protein Q7T86_01690 [Hyphomicrobiaceae bacterium]|nr:hypothetical protein [Hyphomicrobiaceae bacterium]
MNDDHQYYRYVVEFYGCHETGKLLPQHIAVSGTFWPKMPRILSDRELDFDNSVMGYDFALECAFDKSTSPLSTLDVFNVDVDVLYSELCRAARQYYGFDDGPPYGCEIEVIPPDGETEYEREPYDTDRWTDRMAS